MDTMTFDQILTSAPVALLVTDGAGRGIHASERFAQLIVADPLGDGWMAPIEPDDQPRVAVIVARAAALGEHTVLRCRLVDGRCLELEIAPRLDASGSPVGAIAVATVDVDASVLAGLDERIDSLTGAANRDGVLTHLAAVLTAPDLPGRRPSSIGVLVMDLDGFSEVNERLGIRAGDELLGAVVGRLRGAVRFCDLVGRTDADRFVVVAEQDGDAGAIEHVADRVLASFERPFRLEAGTVRISAAAGVVVGDRTFAAEELLAQASHAVLAAQAAGGRCWRRVDSLRLVR